MALVDPMTLYPDLDTRSVEYAHDFSTAGLRSWLRTDKMLDLLDYWNDVRAFRRCPDRLDIDLASIPILAQWLILVERPSPFSGCVFLNVGSRITELAGLDITRQPLSALPDPDYRRMFQENCESVMRAAVPLASRYRRLLPRGMYAFERLDLPLNQEPGRVGAVLIGMVATPLG